MDFFNIHPGKTVSREIEKTAEVIGNHAEPGILFVDGPVHDLHDMNADFSGKALDDMQVLISGRFTGKEIGPLKKTGPAPRNDRVQMPVTNAIDGSFDFVLPEACGALGNG